jgi:hypothetical protein
LKLITMSGTYQGCILIFEKRWCLTFNLWY